MYINLTNFDALKIRVLECENSCKISINNFSVYYNLFKERIVTVIPKKGVFNSQK